jgi:leucyl aminopeptidase
LIPCIEKITMNATSITTTPNAQATPIITITAEVLPQFLQQQSPKVRNWLAVSGFSGKPHTSAIVPAEDGTAGFVVVGIAKPDDLYALSHLPFSLPAGAYQLASDAPTPLTDHVAALSWQLGSYQFSRYKKAPKAAATLVFPSAAEIYNANEIYAAVVLARDLVNTPTEDMGPQHLAAIAESLARECGATFRDIVGDALLQENFPAIHAVGRASHRPPRLIELCWGDPAHPRIAVVGKGVCFDTGGLNIKGADGMRQMKKDMGGAAHALALARLIMRTKLPVRLQMLIPAVENAIAGNAYRPGEIVPTRAGLQIEIGNTDAEGRVILADALALAAEAKPELIIDFATLTGAARVALGPELPATFANSDEWFQKLNSAAANVQDPIWRMPLWQPYHDMIKSNIGDIINTGGPQAGAVTAALFLERFIPKGQDWIHIDTFSWNPKSRPGRPEGGEAQSLRAAFEMLKTAFQP